MKKIIALEEAGQLGLAIYLLFLFQLNVNGWIMLVLFFLPDAFAIGYLVNKATGAILYNISHHKLVAIVLIVIGVLTKLDNIILIGILFFAHSSFDRMLGYGLKYLDSPNRTHLGFIGKEKYKNG